MNEERKARYLISLGVFILVGVIGGLLFKRVELPLFSFLSLIVINLFMEVRE